MGGEARDHKPGAGNRLFLKRNGDGDEVGKTPPTARVARAGSLAFEHVSGPPSGNVIMGAYLTPATVPPDLKPLLGEDDKFAAVFLLVDGDSVVLHFEAQSEHYVARATADELIAALFGPAGGQALEQAKQSIGSAGAFVKNLAARAKKAGDSRLRIDLWSGKQGDSFVVIDVLKAASSLGHRSAAGFRPVEAQLLFDDLASVKVFGGDQVKAKDAVPGAPIGDWFPLPDDGTIRRTVLGEEGAGAVYAGLFLDGAKVSVAIKPSADAATGAIASLDLNALLARLKAVGGQIGKLVDKLLSALDGKLAFPDLFKGLGGGGFGFKLQLPDLSGFLDFDLGLQLPRLFKGGGGGFDLSGLWPSGFKFSLEGFSLGAMPKLNFPWFGSPKLGGFKIPWERIKALIGGGDGLAMPKLPNLDFDLHWFEGFRLGLGIDLSKYWPELGDSAIGLDLDLGALLSKVEGVGKWILDKLGSAKNWVQKWIHLGDDGVLRIYDAADPGGAMLGFHLLRLLDGAQATDLAPTEMRLPPQQAAAGFSLEAGEAAPEDPKSAEGKKDLADDPKGKARPTKPSGTEMPPMQIKAPAQLAKLLALEEGAAVSASLFVDEGKRVVSVWAEAPSTAYEHHEAVKASVSYGAVQDAVMKRIPQGKGPGSGLDLPIEFDGSSPASAGFKFGDITKIGAAGKKGGVSGHVMWGVERLLGATDWTALVPDELVLDVEGAATVSLGTIPADPPLVGGSRFPIEWAAFRKNVLHADDKDANVYAGIHYATDVVGVSLAKDAAGKEGAFASVHLSFLMRQLERLGKLGEKLFDAMVKAVDGAADLAGSLADKIAKYGQRIWDKFLQIADGLLKLDIGGGNFVAWNLKLQLPHLGLDFDWSKLVPDFNFNFEAGGGTFSLGWLPSLDWSPLSNINLDARWLGKLFSGLPGFDLSKLKGDFGFSFGPLGGFDFGVGVDLRKLLDAFPDLFGGGGERWLSFKLPLGKLLDKLGKVGEWLKKKLGDAAGDVMKHLDLGPDGVLRVFDDKNVIGFDLKRLLDGFDGADLVPVELHGEAGGAEAAPGAPAPAPLAEISVGDRQIDEDKKDASKDDKALAKDHHKVLTPKPKEPQIGEATFAAPAHVVDYLEVKEGSPIQVTIHAGGGHVIAYAFVPGSDRAMVVNVDLARLVGKVEGAGEWIMKKMPAAKGGGISSWLHVGGDGVLRIFDPKQPDGAMLGFHLKRLLDGVDATDLAPTEIRLPPQDKAAGFSVEMGEKAPDDPKSAEGKKDLADDAKGKVRPSKPSGDAHPFEVAAPPQLAAALALEPGKPVSGALYVDAGKETITAWAEAPSTVYGHGEAMKMSLSYGAVRDAVQKRIPPGKGGDGKLPIELDESLLARGAGFKFGDITKIGAAGKKGGVSGHVLWSVERLLGATDLTALVPDELLVDVDGAAAMSLGPIPADPPILGGRLPIEWAAFRKNVLHEEQGTNVHLGVHHAGDLLAVSLAKEADGKEGAYAQVHISWLLQQLKKLGKLADKLFEVLAKLTGKAIDNLKDLGAAILDQLVDLAELAKGLLKIDLSRKGGSGWLSWDIAGHLPSLGMDLDFGRLIPDFNFEFEMAGGGKLGFGWLPKLGWPSLKGIDLDTKWLGKLFDGIPGFDVSKLKGEFGFHFGFLGGLDLGIGIDLSKLAAAFGDLFGGDGGGERWLSFRLPLGALLDKLGKLGKWFKTKLAGGVAWIQDHVELGPDGVLRLFEGDNVIGFDAKRLLDGFDGADLVPVELHGEIGDDKDNKGPSDKPLAEISLGDRKVDENKDPDKDDNALAKDHHKVLTPKPKAAQIASASFEAPALVQEYLGVKPGTEVQVSLHADDSHVIAYAYVPGNDTAMDVRIDFHQLASAVQAKGPLKAPQSAGGIHVDPVLSKAKGSLVVKFGTEKQPGKELGEKQYSGYVAWRLGKLLSGDLSALIPDEGHVENANGGITLGSGIPLAGLHKRAAFAVPDWAKDAVGASTGEVWTNNVDGGEIRAALVAGDNDGKHARGVELDLHKKFVEGIEERMAELMEKAQAKIGKGLNRVRGAGGDPHRAKGQEGLTKKAIHILPDPMGIRVTRGEEGKDPNFMYATFGWNELSNLADGEFKLKNLMPVEFRVATNSMAMEVEELPVAEHPADKPGPNPDEGARKIGHLHPLFRDTLQALGLSANQWLWIDLDATQHAGDKDENPEDHRVKLVAKVFDVDKPDEEKREAVHVTHAKQITGSVRLEAILAQVLPKARKLLKDRKQKQAEKQKAKGELKPGEKRLRGSIGLTPDLADTHESGDAGVEMTVGVDMKSKKGKERHLELTAGWTLSQILDVLLHLDQMVDEEGMPRADAVAKMVPKAVRGSFANDLFKLSIGTGGAASEHNTKASNIPYMDDLLGEFMDPATAAKCVFHLSLPDTGKLVNELKGVLDGGYVEVGECALQVPLEDGEQWYSIQLWASPGLFKRLAQFIPYVGVIIKLVSAAEGILKDPMGTLEGLAYTPEALYHFVDNFGEIVDDIKDMGWKDVAMMLVMSGDVSAKQAVMAARLHKKYKNEPWYQEMRKGKKPSSVPTDIPAEYLEYLTGIPEETFESLAKYGQTLEKMHVDVEKDYTVPTHTPTADELDAKTMLVERGYSQYAQTMDALKAEQDPVKKAALEKELDAKAKQIKEYVDKFTGAGARPSQRFEDQRNPDAPIPEYKMPDHPLTDVTGMPMPSEEAEEKARSIFGEAKPGDTNTGSGLERDYLIKKYAHLSVDELGELLVNKKISINLNGGPVEIQMFEDERGFVRTLFVMLVDPTAKVIPEGQAATGGMTDEMLVARWKAKTLGAEGAKPGQPKSTDPTQAGRNSDAKRDPKNTRKGTGKKKGGKGGGKGNNGTGPTGDAGTMREGGDGSGKDGTGTGTAEDDYDSDYEDAGFSDEDEWMETGVDQGHQGAEGEGEDVSQGKATSSGKPGGGVVVEDGDFEVNGGGADQGGDQQGGDQQGDDQQQGGDDAGQGQQQVNDDTVIVDNISQAQLAALVVWDDKDGLHVSPTALEDFKKIKVTGAGGEIRVTNVWTRVAEKVGPADDPTFLLSVHFEKTIGGKKARTETLNMSWRKQTGQFDARRSDDKLSTQVAEELTVYDKKVVQSDKGDGVIKTDQVEFSIKNVRASGDLGGGLWAAILDIDVVSATDGYMLLDRDNNHFRVKDFEGKSTTIRLAVRDPNFVPPK